MTLSTTAFLEHFLSAMKAIEEPSHQRNNVFHSHYRTLVLVGDVVKLDQLTVGCVFLMNFQKWVQLSLSSLPNNMATPSVNMEPFAVFAYAEYSVYSPKLMWAASVYKTSCKKGTCFFDVDGEMKKPIKNLY